MPGQGRLRVAGRSHDVQVRRTAAGWEVTVDGEVFQLPAPAGVADAARGVVRLGSSEIPYQVEEWAQHGAAAQGAAGAATRVRAPMSGRLVEVRVQEGAAVGRGDVLFVLEAMKMQNEVRSPAAGVVSAVQAKAGETLETDRVVLEIHPAGAPS